MSLLKFYTTNKIEFEKDGYFDNNTAIIENDQTPYIYYNIGSSRVIASITAYLYVLDKEKLKNGVISEYLIDSFSGTQSEETIYLDSQAFASEGIYRFYLTYDGVTVYSDIFCINSITFDTIEKMKSGVLRIYKGDYFEFQKDGYFENNTLLNYEYQIAGFKFDTELDISAVTVWLYGINKTDLNIKYINEYLIKSVSASNDGETVYLNNDYFASTGIYRYKITVRPVIGADVDFYSDCFCVKELADMGDVRQFVDDTYRQFAGGTFRIFAD